MGTEPPREWDWIQNVKGLNILKIMIGLHMSFKVKTVKPQNKCKEGQYSSGLSHEGHIDAFLQMLNSLKETFFPFCFGVSTLVMPEGLSWRPLEESVPGNVSEGGALAH